LFGLFVEELGMWPIPLRARQITSKEIIEFPHTGGNTRIVKLYSTPTNIDT
jgi:hypothetical protein